MLDDTGRPHKYCPVRSFENYLGRLNPDDEHLWQTPLNKIWNMKEQNVWYKAEAKGHNPIEKFMGNWFKQYELSDHYTNHCIRVTSATNLAHCGKYTAKQIMSVTGHKSIQSLRICHV